MKLIEWVEQKIREKHIALNTLDVHLMMLKLLKEAFPQYLLAKDIEPKHLSYFHKFLSQKGYELSTIRKMEGVLKQYLKPLIDIKVIENDIYRFYKIPSLIPKPVVFLSVEELKYLWKMHLKKPSEIMARDTFIFSAFTALALKELETVSKDNIITWSGKKYIQLYRFKSPTDKIMIPIKPVVNEIFEKYNGILPTNVNFVNGLSRRTYNNTLKAITAKTNFNEIISYIKVINGQKKIVSKRKKEMITSHTARRSAATNMVREGLNPELVRAITGHTTIEALYRYIGINVEQSAEILYESNFFKDEL